MTYTLGKFVENPPYKDTESYETLLTEVTGSEIVAKVDIGDYSGDLYFLLEREGNLGFVSQAYGSCSGCDDLCACENAQDFERLGKSMANAVRWFECAEDFESWAQNIEDGVLPDGKEAVLELWEQYKNS